MFETAPVALAHGIEPSALDATLKAHGWDFSILGQSEDKDVVAFVRDTVTRYATQLADRRAKLEAREAAQRSARLGRMTSAAKANPELTCGKCDGKGRLDCFSHIEKGTCFWCKGSGVIKPRRRAA